MDLSGCMFMCGRAVGVMNMLLQLLLFGQDAFVQGVGSGGDRVSPCVPLHKKIKGGCCLEK